MNDYKYCNNDNNNGDVDDDDDDDDEIEDFFHGQLELRDSHRSVIIHGVNTSTTPH